MGRKVVSLLPLGELSPLLSLEYQEAGSKACMAVT
jgi:hypothetical protein